ncbi:hypothetical protein ACHQM5_029359 [Ranunculus cassubicifolius]
MGLAEVFRCVKLVNEFHPRRSEIICRFLVKRRFSSFADKKECDILPVLIVGAGPVGLALCVLLTKLGVNCEILEKNKTFSQHPQAHFINNRSMEVFRKFDNLAQKIQSLQPPVELWRKFIYCTSLSGSILGSVDHIEPEDLEQDVSPVSVAHFSQYKLNKLLLQQIENLGFRVSTYDELDGSNHDLIGGRKILMGHECRSIEATDHGIMVGVSSSKNGMEVNRKVLCKVLVGSDGAGSVVRKLMGIKMNGEKDLQKLISVHFISKDLGQYLLNERPGMLFFIFNVEAIGVLVAHDLSEGEFVLQIPFYPPQQSLEDFKSEVCKDLIFKLAGRKLEDIDVRDIKPWVMHAEVAENFVSCDNRVLLVGDAAHRFPPAGGFGMNTGIQDAHNLAWKIASHLKGIAPSSILRTYETERRPIALFNTALSVQNFKAAMSVPSALGLDPTVANSVHGAINSAVGSILPSGVQKTLLDGFFTIGRAQVGDSFLNKSNPLGSSRLAKLRRIFHEGKSLQLQFPAEDLGFRYVEGALVPDTGVSQNVLEVPTGRRRDYVPLAEPGARLPHMRVRMLQTSTSEEILSTLDLVSSDKLEFLLIIAPLRKSYELAQAAFMFAQKLSIGLKVCVMWSHSDSCSSERTSGSKAALDPWENYVDVEEIRRSPLSSLWWEMCKMTDKGAILVRPDEHIAWRTKGAVLNDPALEMENIFCKVLGVERIHAKSN